MTIDRAWGAECAWPDGRSTPAGSGHFPWPSLTLALVFLGALQFGHEAWIEAKAWIAQRLVAQAWSRVRLGEANGRPWPWADAWPVARLTVPALGVERFVLAGAGGRSLAFGPGHLSGTSMPGDAGNSVIGGQRDTHLGFLGLLRAGDIVEIERVDGARVAYRVQAALVLDARDVWIAKQEGPTRLTLISYFPFAAWRAGGLQRYVVFAFELEDRGGERGTRG